MKIPDYNKKIKNPTYLKMQEEIERLNNDIKALFKENSNKEKVIKAQDNIIKEVREYINGIGWNTTIPNIQDNVWRILDKENNNV